MTKEKLLEALDAISRGDMPESVVVHASKTTTDADWEAINPNSLETECRDCGAYYAMEWKEGEQPPEKLVCPECGSGNHGGVGSPAGGYHLLMHDPRLP